MVLSELNVLEAAPDGIVVAGSEGRVEFFNPAAERLFGYSSAEIAGRDFGELLSSDESASMLFASAEATVGRLRALEVRARCSSGALFWASLSIGAAEGRSGRTGYVAIFRDISVQAAEAERLCALEARLAALTRLALAGEVAAGMAHEINQPLSAIATYAQAAKRVMDSSAPDLRVLANVCNKIDDQARRAGDVVQSIRELIHRPKPDIAVLDINDVVADVMSLIEADARMEGVSVTVEYARPLPAVRADAVHLQAVLLTLIRNAMEAMRESDRAKRRIMIRTLLDESGRVRVSVADCGPGVPASLEGRIFDPFVTSDRRRLGIGLSMSQNAVNAHEGGLTYESNPNGGSTFMVDLPAFRPEA